MAVESATPNLDLNTLLTGAKMGNLLDGGSGDGLGGGVLLGLLLGRSGILGGNANDTVGGERAAIDAAVAAALASANQANNNSMLLLKDIQDSSQDVVAAINSNASNLLTNQLQGQIATLQGNAAILAGVEASKGAVINEVHETSTDLSNQLNHINTNLLAGFNSVSKDITNDGDKTRALIQGIETANLNRQIVVAQNEISDLKNHNAIAASGVNVTNNINQTQTQQQQQQQLWNINNQLQDLLAQQKITQGIINVGGTVAGASQTAANTRVNS